MLHTEAVRVLLPVATALVDERVASFAAALMAGVADKYGGDPDHLAIITATMPDQETGRDRQFLVLHDTLPGGTGYLHRLADQKELRQVLVSARAVVAGCRCADDGKRACHRCLLSHIDDDKWPLVSRAEALSMLDDLLQGWTITSVASTGEISLASQVESELEARFWKVLKNWTATEPAVSLTPAATVNGRSTAALRTDSAHWQVTMHHRARGTIPDLEFARSDQDAPKVVVYLDGYKYHAAPDKNRTAEDADKRAELRADGAVVFQFDWEAVTDMADDVTSEDVPWPPYQGNAQARARTAYQKAVRLPDQPGHRRHRLLRHGVTRRNRQADRDRRPAAAVRCLFGIAADRAGRGRPLLSTIGKIKTEEQLLEFIECVPQLTADVLFALHDGDSVEEVLERVTAPVSVAEPVDPTDYAAAVARPASLVTTDDETLQAILQGGFERWQVYLHPAQRRVVERSYSGPARVSGGPGTGKTIVALHRVKWLVERLPPGSSGRDVLFTTFNKNLAVDLRQRLLLLGGPELLDRVDVVNIDRLPLRSSTRRSQASGCTGWMTPRPSTCGVRCCSS